MNGMNDCVGKPFTSQELWRCLMKYFKPVDRQIEDRTRRMQTENELRQKLITDFVKDNQNGFNEIMRAVNAGDIKTAHRLAHTLKSSAGYLGKTLLQQAAAKVEHQLKDGRNLVTMEQMAALETELKAALAEFSELMDGFSVSGPEPAIHIEPVDAKTARELFAKLELSLYTGNPECRQLINSLSRIPGTEELIRQIDDLDFVPALATLEALKKSLGIPY